MTFRHANGGKGGEKRKSYPSERPMFDSAVKRSKFFEAFSKLKDGSTEPAQLTGIITGLNSTKDRAEYSTEIIGMKKAFRDLLPRMKHSEPVAQFLRDAAAMIVSVSETIGNEIIFGLSKAAENENYVETVNSSISGLKMERLNSLKEKVGKRIQWKAEKELAAAREAEGDAEQESADPEGNGSPAPIEQTLQIETNREPVRGWVPVHEPDAELEDDYSSPTPDPTVQSKPEERKAPGFVMWIIGGITIAAVAAFIVFAQKKPEENEPQKPLATTPKTIEKKKPETTVEPEVVPMPAVEEKKAEPPVEPKPEIRKKPIKKPTRRELLLQRLERLSPENPDEAKAQAEEFARAIKYSRPDDAVQIVGRLGSMVSESPDAGSNNKKKFAISALRRVAVTGDDETAVEAISELGRIAGSETEVTAVLEGLGAEEAIQKSEARKQALKKALEEGYTME